MRPPAFVVWTFFFDHAVAPSQVEYDGAQVIVRHLYIERRLMPLNLFLANADDAARIRAMRDYGDAIRELAAVNIFPGDPKRGARPRPSPSPPSR